LPQLHNQVPPGELLLSRLRGHHQQGQAVSQVSTTHIHISTHTHALYLVDLRRAANRGKTETRVACILMWRRDVDAAAPSASAREITYDREPTATTTTTQQQQNNAHFPSWPRASGRFPTANG
jgi:hypothetical protein